MVDFFTDMVINDNYAPPIPKASGSDAKDMSVTINALNKGAKIIPLPGEFGTGIVAAKKSDGKYYISSGARASAPLDPEAKAQGYSLKELADILAINYKPVQTSGFLPVEGGPFSRTFNVDDITPKPENNEFSK